ncbi:hypothetical protein TNCV_290421 [Trichonephila clavipes]|nr:hypothetical protein TNCV_290421 [Trichonephila clavipes]
MELERREIFRSVSAPVVSAVTTHKTFGPIDLTKAYSVYTRRVFVGIGIEPRPSGLDSDGIKTRLPTVLNVYTMIAWGSFIEIVQDVESRNMAGSVWSNSSKTEITTTPIAQMIEKDLRVTLRELPSEVGLSYGSVQHIVFDLLQYSKTVQ